MIEGKRVLAVIPARGQSKGVPRKNIRMICGKALIAYTIEAARRSRYIDRLVVSTEDPEIRQIAMTYDAEVLNRPPHLAEDETPGIDPVLHALESCPGFDYVVLLQPTSPLRTVKHIDEALEHCLYQKAPACVSVCAADTTPQRLFELDQTHHLKRFMPVEGAPRRQDLPPFYVLNGAVYIADVEWLKQERRFVASKTVAYLMSRDNSLDIDSELDMQFFDFCVKNNIGATFS